jgi:hypothetical protein
MMKEALEKELYEAWLATYEVHGGMDCIEEGRIYARAQAAYEKAYDELGPRWTQNILIAARKAAGIEIETI